MNANEVYLSLLEMVSLEGDTNIAPRGMATSELRCARTSIDMRSPIVTLPARELDYQFMAAEAYWVLSGDRGLSHPALERNLKKYSDDGRTMRGAYGPPFVQQVEYVMNTLALDPDSRQAVMTLWERNPRPGRDIPCTVALQWLIRGGKIHTNVFMRSSDAWLGWPYDVFTFTMMTCYLRSLLHQKYELGTLFIVAGSQHLYERNLPAVERVLASKESGKNLVLDYTKINTPDSIMNHLNGVRNDTTNPLYSLKYTLCQ